MPEDQEKLSYTDKLAIERTLLANERTFLAYFRTTVVFLSSGIAILKLDVLDDLMALAYLLIVLAVLLMGVGSLRYFQVKKRLSVAK
jgi:putative membrane protein